MLMQQLSSIQTEMCSAASMMSQEVQQGSPGFVRAELSKAKHATYSTEMQYYGEAEEHC